MEHIYKLLIVDDEKDILSLLSEYFEFNGYYVITASSGTDALEQISKSPDLILLDINMPDIDGMSVCERIRNHVSCPILFLTAKTESTDKIKGFAVGGDDYITKPFSLDVLGARVQAHLRRENRQKHSNKIKFNNGLVIDYSEKAVYFNELQLPFVKKEFDIIELLSQNAGQTFDKERIYERIWGYDSEGDSSVIVEHIRRIRAKFTNAGCGQFITTVWGVGYKWEK